MNVKIPIPESSKNGYGCFFQIRDHINGNGPFKPLLKCVLYTSMGEDKPECKDCKINHVIINAEEE